MADKSFKFSVIDPYGLSANSWGVQADRHGEVYVYCRDHMKEIKASFHKSGQQHVAYKDGSPQADQTESRFIHQWLVPAHHGDVEFVPTFNLIFPHWGLGLTEDMRQALPKVWGKPHVFIKAAEAPRVTVVSFVIKSRGIDLTPDPHETTSAVPVAHLDVGSDRTLWVHVQHRGEGNLRGGAIKAVAEANSWPDTTVALETYPVGHVFGLCVSGFDNEKVPYMMPFPAPLMDGRDNEPRRLATPFTSVVER